MCLRESLSGHLRKEHSMSSTLLRVVRTLPTIAALGAMALPMASFADEKPALVTFEFQTVASRNPNFDRAAFAYPAGHAKAGQLNPDAGDIRLDSVIVAGVTYRQAQLQLATAANIIKDDAVDAARGGGNLTTGFGIGASRDTWVAEGVGTTTPTAANIRDAHANFNLSSIVPVRENVGTAIYELTFARPTDTVLLWERGNSGDVLVEAIDARGAVIGATLVLDGANDGGKPSSYKPTGIVVTTYVKDDFLNQGQELSAVGLRASQPVSTFRFTALQQAEGAGAARYNGPDLKVVALAPRS